MADVSRLRALLCDLDGTLADSEPLHRAAWLTLLSEDFGIERDEHWFEQFVGTSDRVVARHIVDNHDTGLSIAELTERKQRRFHAAVRRQGNLFPGVAEGLGRIAGRFPLAIATNSGRADADLMIEATALGRYTSVSVTASDVENMKPAPDIYQLAAERLGVAASDCIAIEDSGPGGASARAAGCYLIGLTDLVREPDERVADNATALQRAYELLTAAGGKN